MFYLMEFGKRSVIWCMTDLHQCEQTVWSAMTSMLTCNCAMTSMLICNSCHAGFPHAISTFRAEPSHDTLVSCSLPGLHRRCLRLSRIPSRTIGVALFVGMIITWIWCDDLNSKSVVYIYIYMYIHTYIHNYIYPHDSDARVCVRVYTCVN